MDGSGIDACISENILATKAPERTREPCGYIIAEGGAGVRFCDEPAAAGSSYCARHRAICSVAPDTPEGRALAAELAREADRPPLPGVGCHPLLELEDIEPAEVIELLDLPQPADEDAP